MLSAEIGTKNFRIRYDPLTDLRVDNKVKLPVPEQERKKFAVSQKFIASVYNLGMFAEHHFKTPQDIELVISRGEIIITQSRPITTG